MRKVLMAVSIITWTLVAYQLGGFMTGPSVTELADQVPIAAPVDQLEIADITTVPSIAAPVTTAAPVVTTTTIAVPVTTIAAPVEIATPLLVLDLPEDADGRQCFEDEVVVVFAQGWTGTHHEAGLATGDLYCAPWDDLRPIETD